MNANIGIMEKESLRERFNAVWMGMKGRKESGEAF
jgi:hypothetical protein